MWVCLYPPPHIPPFTPHPPTTHYLLLATHYPIHYSWANFSKFNDMWYRYTSFCQLPEGDKLSTNKLKDFYEISFNTEHPRYLCWDRSQFCQGASSLGLIDRVELVLNQEAPVGFFGDICGTPIWLFGSTRLRTGSSDSDWKSVWTLLRTTQHPQSEQWVDRFGLFRWRTKLVCNSTTPNALWATEGTYLADPHQSIQVVIDWPSSTHLEGDPHHPSRLQDLNSGGEDWANTFTAMVVKVSMDHNHMSKGMVS